MNWFAIIFGAIVGLAGLVVLASALRKRHEADDPRAKAMLIGGTMALAFGIVLAGFAIAYGAAGPLNATEGAR